MSDGKLVKTLIERDNPLGHRISRSEGGECDDGVWLMNVK